MQISSHKIWGHNFWSNFGNKVAHRPLVCFLICSLVLLTFILVLHRNPTFCNFPEWILATNGDTKPPIWLICCAYNAKLCGYMLAKCGVSEGSRKGHKLANIDQHLTIYYLIIYSHISFKDVLEPCRNICSHVAAPSQSCGRRQKPKRPHYL